jgi:ATP adenylyltransferase
VDQLWAPWRMGYVQTKPNPTANSCFLCQILQETEDRENLVLRRTSQSIVVLNRYPYNNGHLLIAPREHLANLQDLTPECLLDLQFQLRDMMDLLSECIKAEGFNVGLNLGRVAGAGLPGHLHWHIVPRWSGDTNFMPVMTDARVIVQSLDALWLILNEKMSSNS